MVAAEGQGGKAAGAVVVVRVEDEPEVVELAAMATEEVDWSEVAETGVAQVATVVGWEAGSPAVEEAGKAAATVMAAHSRLGSALGLWPMQQRRTWGSSSS